ncbi:MAG: TonB-dependent siderophore receptor [Gluconobacter potus]|uniref:TonB-dependent siderophore receptor n=1 Tax=Gluconobacter potus TaxID=2724927 RepID=A0ABR9YPG4_9PROT|nr:TonB-dependent siderophore receptor [Gluconobacter sp. R71656]MBF0868695.1 TonB-dependent siderophore receptor [Gluconobacter sp. R75628]MBF0874677.1 TonB-dependent siderophore receptor [Gluconobacter sp. R75629]MBF0883692.1 TonB-dependent siderophore receptor [Gluconobacter potus]
MRASFSVPFSRPLRAARLSCLLLAGTAFPVLAADPVPTTATATTPKTKPATKPASAAEQVTPDEEIIVRARKRDQMQVSSGGQLGALGNKKGLDVPFNIRSYNSSLILNQQSQTLGEVLENDPSVRTTFGYGNFSEMFVIRGFAVDGDDVSINGLYGITPRQLVSPELYDQVQVLNGASAFLNGAAPSGSAIGGNINLLFKHATNAPLTRISGDYTSSAMGGGSIDVGRRFGEDKAFGVRLNVAGKSGEDSVTDEYRHSTTLGADFDWHDRSNRTRITMDIDYENQGVNGGRPAIFLGSAVTSVPRPAAPSHNFGQRWAYNNLNYVFGMLNIEHDLTKNVTLYGAFGALTSNEKGNYSSPTVTDPTTGAGTAGAMYVPYDQTNESTRAGVRAHFRTGPIRHEINAGGSGLWEDSAAAYAMTLTSHATNIYNTPQFATPAETYAGGVVNDPQTIDRTRLYSLFFSDTMSFFHDRVALTGGFRYQNMLINGYAYSKTGQGAMSSHYDQDAITPVVGLVIHPTRRTSLYFNRIEGLSQGPTATGNVVNLGEIFPPYKSTQYEVGAKYDTGRFSAALAVYEISQPNAYSVAVGNTGEFAYREDGLQRNRGIELTLNGEILPGLRFNGGGTVIQADLRHTAGGLQDGNTAIGVPNYTINGNLEYDLPFLKGATVVGRVVNTGKQWVNTANTLHIPVWTRFDLAGRYTFVTHHTPVTLRFGVDNLANTRYWSSAFNGYLLQGMPRTFKFSFTTDL